MPAGDGPYIVYCCARSGCQACCVGVKLLVFTHVVLCCAVLQA